VVTALRPVSTCRTVRFPGSPSGASARRQCLIVPDDAASGERRVAAGLEEQPGGDVAPRAAALSDAAD
jgi:hypothetical protein